MFNDFISLFFPSYCFSCQSALVKGESYICTTCRLDLPQTQLHLEPSNILYQKLIGINKLQNAYAYLKFVKSGKIQKLLHKLKYENYPEVGHLLGRWYGYELMQSGIHKELDLIIPIPLHPTKLRQRGYNQSDHFAAGLSDSMKVPWSAQVVSRIKKSATQTQKDRLERWKNVENIFKVNNPEKVIQKRLLLVDDVITTGSTLAACAQALDKYQYQSIQIATIAMAQ
ncbi:MAG: ComF family protein [Candidatus Cyclobacteriaceae bacterium M3_2C_046]